MATAKRLAKNQGVMGSDAKVIEFGLTMIGAMPYLPATLINIEYPTKEDEAEQKRVDSLSEVIRKAKEAGLSDEDIKQLQQGGK